MEMSQYQIDELYKQINTHEKADQLMSDLEIDPRFPPSPKGSFCIRLQTGK
jgi:hypothetical protein